MRKRTKKLIVCLAATAMAVTTLAGCGEKATESSETAKVEKTQETTNEVAKESPEEHEKVTLRFSWWGGDSRHEATLAVIEQFQELYPWITIEAEYGSSDGYSDKLATQLASGTEPDIMQIDPETMPQFVQAGDYFVDYFTSDFDFEYYDLDSISSSYITGHYDGKQFGIPTGVAGPCMLVNKTVADAVGADFTNSYTWEDLITWGKAARALGDDIYLLSTNVSYLNNMVVNYYTKQLTGNTMFDTTTGKLLVTEADLVKTFEYVNSLFENEVVEPISVMVQYEGDNLQNDPAWISGKYACNFTYISTATVLTAANPNAEYYAGEFPVMNNAKNDGWIIGCPQIMAVSKNSEHIEESIMFLNYFFNNDTALSTLNTQRSVPFTSHACEIVEKDGNLNPLLSQSVEVLTPYSGLANDSISSTAEAKQMVEDAITAMAYGQLTPAEAAAELMRGYKALEKQF